MKAKYFSKVKDEQVFFSELKQRVKLKLEGKKVNYGDFSFWAKGLFWTIVCYFSYSMLLFSTLSKIEFWLIFVVFQLSGLLIGFSFGHDASHNTAFKNKKLNSVLHFSMHIRVRV